MHKKITHPDQLEQLTVAELCRCVRPLLRKAGMPANDARWARIAPEIPSVCAELAAAWRNDPRIDGRPVGFDSYLAAKLATTLHTLDRARTPSSTPAAATTRTPRHSSWPKRRPSRPPPTTRASPPPGAKRSRR